MPCCWAHHHHCCRYPWSDAETVGHRRWRSVAREDLEDLEEERERLEARLRRLERQLEELRRASSGPERQQA
jgi:hypothetical protein